MKEVMKIGSKLAIICAVAAIALGIANAITELRKNRKFPSLFLKKFFHPSPTRRKPSINTFKHF